VCANTGGNLIAACGCQTTVDCPAGETSWGVGMPPPGPGVSFSTCQ
jgi:hypothetical protein